MYKKYGLRKRRKGGGGGAKSLNFRGGTRSLKGRAKSLGISPWGGGGGNPCDTGSRLEGSELLTSEFLRFRSRLDKTSGGLGKIDVGS